MTSFARLIIIAAALAASGCVASLVETNPPKPRYLIGSVDQGLLTGDRVDWSLVVENPASARAYDTTKVAISRSPGRIEYFGDGEWAGRAPRIFQTALIESFENSDRIIAVGDRSALPLGDFSLQTDIREINLDVSGGARTARLAVYARIGNGRSEIYAAKRFSASVEASSLSGDDVANAFDRAFKAVITEIVAWTFDEGETANASS